jgi:CMP-N,N'-diacetyllegionaminic acid synthase
MDKRGSAFAVLGIVPARGGSQGIRRKNIRLLDGKPLLAFTADAARRSEHLTRVLLSSEDPEIVKVGKAVGLDAPFLRPAELALDSTPMIGVVLHAIRWAKSQGEHYDAICLLQPTSPLRSAQMIDRCIARLWESGADCVISVRPVPKEYNPHWVYLETAEGLLAPCMGSEPIPARQLLPPAYHPDGGVFAARTEAVLANGTLYGARTVGVVSPVEEACDLDTEEQWEELARRIKTQHNVSSPN